MHGSGSPGPLAGFDNQLVDEITLLTYPVVVDQGTRLFPDTGPHKALSESQFTVSDPDGNVSGCLQAGMPVYGVRGPGFAAPAFRRQMSSSAWWSLVGA